MSEGSKPPENLTPVTESIDRLTAATESVATPVTESVDRLTAVSATQKTVASVTIDQERWRSQVLEGRFMSLRNQATALLAVMGVVLGIAAGAIGNLTARKLSPLVTVLVIAGITVSVAVLVVGGILIIYSLQVQPRTEYPSPAGLATTIEGTEAKSLFELDAYRNTLNKTIRDMRQILQRAAVALGVGVALGIAVAAGLFFAKSQPTQNRLVQGSTVTVKTVP